MIRVKALWRRVPLWIRHTVRAVAFLVLMIFGVGINAQISDTSGWANFADLAVLLAVLVGLFFLARRSMDRKLGGPGQAVMFRQAVRSGSIPATADRPSWRSALEGRAERHSQTRGYGIAMIIVFALFFGSQFVIAFVRNPDDRLAVAGEVAVFVLLVAAMAWMTFRVVPRKQARVDSLASQLEEPNRNF